jgi:fatty acid desaturase
MVLVMMGVRRRASAGGLAKQSMTGVLPMISSALISDVLPVADRESKRLVARDVRVYVAKLSLLVTLVVASIALIVSAPWYVAAIGQLVLGTMFAHAVELQHQALHGTGFRSTRANRTAGVVLGLPLMVSYSRYRTLHLLHHRYLGTSNDTEFFEYEAVGELTYSSLLRSAVNVRRWVGALGDMVRSWHPGTRYDRVIIKDRTHSRIREEYRLMSLSLLTLAAVSWAVSRPLLVTVWLIPLVIGEVVHFLIELPEHVFCDRSTTDVFRNTRSIRGSWFSFWLTNGNNLHVEHHVRMGVPINKLPELHQTTRPYVQNYRETYWQFYRDVLRKVRGER